MISRLTVLFLSAAYTYLGGGCSALSCGADQQKLAKLKPGMTYEDTSHLMGCAGRLVSVHGLEEAGEYATIEWDGPDSLLFTRTQVVFFDRKLYSYTTNKRGGF
jgi:hypothetical protein